MNHGILIGAIIGLLAAGAVAKEFEPGKSRWTIKTSTPPGADLVHPKVITFDQFASLPAPPGVVKEDKRYQSKRIPAFDNPLSLTEGDIVQVDAWVQLVAAEPDGDYHIQVTKEEKGFQDCMIVEAPSDNLRFVKDAALRANTAAVRSAIQAAGLRGNDPGSATIVKPVRMRFTGQLFYDDSHVGTPPRGKKGCKALSLWEIHPITSALSIGSTIADK